MLSFCPPNFDAFAVEQVSGGQQGHGGNSGPWGDHTVMGRLSWEKVDSSMIRGVSDTPAWWRPISYREVCILSKYKTKMEANTFCCFIMHY